MARDRRLQRLRREELLQILLELEEENEQLTEENVRLKKKLDEREIAIAEAGNLAEAALSLSGVFAAAQEAADIYLHNVERMCSQRLGKADEGDGES